MSPYLITGTSSGLGKYLYGNLGGISFDRQTPKDHQAEIIIHCAFNRTKNVTTRNLYQYLSDNVFLTKRLAKNPHKKFIHISSIDIYPQDNKKHSEDEVINVNKVATIYAFTKLLSESIIQNLCPNFLILRCVTLLGKDSKDNSLIKIIKDNHPSLTLSATSVFNYILHKDVLAFIKLAIEKDLHGIYNLASSKNITLAQVSNVMKKNVSFGTFFYTVGNINNTKAALILPSFKKTSTEVISEFLSR